MQFSIFKNGEKETTYIESVDINLVRISEHNPRKTWDDRHIDRLAELIDRNGFDKAFALKCHDIDGFYYCFAGSNRLKAAIKLNKSEVPIFKYTGYTPQEIWRMAYDDNEQADAQQQFNMVDIWLDYKAKSEAGMTQQQIADVLGIARSNVSRRLLFSDWPQSVLNKIVTSPFVKDVHCRELLELSHCDNFPLETLLCEIIDIAGEKYREPTSTQVKSIVNQYNEAIESVKTWSQKLTGTFKDEFLQSIAKERTAAVIDNKGRILLGKQEAELENEWLKKEAELNEANKKRLELKREADKHAKVAEIISRVANEDSKTWVQTIPDGIKLVFTDPPYGMDFQSNRRIASAKAGKIDGDNGVDQAIDLCKNIITPLIHKMLPDSAVLMWCTWEYEPELRDLLKSFGLIVKNSIIWHKPNHGSGELTTR
jgi:ParB/RepB/Spo0J family partition protein